MRLYSLNSTTQRLIFLGLVALLFLALAIFGASTTGKTTQTKKGVVPSRVQGQQRVSEVNMDESQQASNEDSDDNQNSSSTKVHVSVNSTTTNGETTGSATAEVTQNGETQTFTQDLDEITDGGNFRVRVNNGEFDFDIDFDQDTKNKSSSETDVKMRQRTRD